MFEWVNLPSWASGFTDTFEVGAIIPTKDGRKVGNAVIISSVTTNVDTFYTIKTDIGNVLTLTLKELESYFYPPTYLSKEVTDETYKDKPE